jgi:hypothetical protein
VEFGIQPPRKYLKTKQKWNLEFNHLRTIQKQKRKRPIPDSSPRDLATKECFGTPTDHGFEHLILKNNQDE